ncbi:MAG: tryptophan synthase subunit alpha [Alphaproteobacteria bacterium]|nr:tryptophan synthase subunit alpha [Alphaproteobacteria bacterium]
MKRIGKKFKTLRAQRKCGLVAYICAGDPDYETSLATLKAMPAAGVDVIELGVPFLDPAGDGPIIEMAAKRAIAGGMTLKKTLKMVSEFRETDQETPLILMSYYNPILKFGLNPNPSLESPHSSYLSQNSADSALRFRSSPYDKYAVGAVRGPSQHNHGLARDRGDSNDGFGLNKLFAEAEKSGVDGFLIVDLPPEEEGEILLNFSKTNLDLIRLVAPTTDISRSKKIAKNAGGFLYLISMLGITGTTLANARDNKKNLENLKKISDLPIAIGFGIQTAKQVREFSQIGADAVVVGSVLVKEMAEKKSVLAVINKIQEFAKCLKE